MCPFRAVGFSSMASGFMGAHNDLLDLARQHGVSIHAIEIEGRLRLFMEIAEGNSTDPLRDSVPAALLLRAALTKWQGTRSPDLLFWREIAVRKEQGVKSNQLASEINQTLGKLLQEQAAWEKRCANNSLTITDWVVVPLDTARLIMQTLRFKENEIEQTLAEGMKNVRSGHPAFERSFPVDWEILTNKLKAWKYAGKNPKTPKTKRIRGRKISS